MQVWYYLISILWILFNLFIYIKSCCLPPFSICFFILFIYIKSCSFPSIGVFIFIHLIVFYSLTLIPTPILTPTYPAPFYRPPSTWSWHKRNRVPEYQSLSLDWRERSLTPSACQTNDLLPASLTSSTSLSWFLPVFSSLW